MRTIYSVFENKEEGKKTFEMNEKGIALSQATLSHNKY